MNETIKSLAEQMYRNLDIDTDGELEEHIDEELFINAFKSVMRNYYVICGDILE